MLSRFKSKNKVKFEVSVKIEELTNLPMMNALFFVQWKVKGGGNARGVTERVHVSKYMAAWAESFAFEVAMSTAEETGQLQSLYIHFNVRMEMSGRKGYEQIGKVIADLAEFAGAKTTTRTFLLQRSRLNSTLQVTISMRQTAGDPYFKVPTTTTAPQTFIIQPDTAATLERPSTPTAAPFNVDHMQPVRAPRPFRMPSTPTEPLPDRFRRHPDVVVEQLILEHAPEHFKFSPPL